MFITSENRAAFFNSMLVFSHYSEFHYNANNSIVYNVSVTSELNIRSNF